MSPPSSRSPDGPPDGAAGAPRDARRQSRTAYEYLPAPAAPAAREKHTVFGMPQAEVGAEHGREGSAPPGGTPLGGFTTPQFRVPHNLRSTTPAPAVVAQAPVAVLASPVVAAHGRTDARDGVVPPARAPVAPIYGVGAAAGAPPAGTHAAATPGAYLPPAASPFEQARATARAPYEAPTARHEAPAVRYESPAIPYQSSLRPDRMADLETHYAAPAATPAPAAAPGLGYHDSPSSREAPGAEPPSSPGPAGRPPSALEGATAFVDMREIASRGGVLPALGRSEESSSRWAEPAETSEHAARAGHSQPRPPARAEARGRLRSASQAASADDEIAIPGLGRPARKQLLIAGGAAVAALLLVVSFFAGGGSDPAPTTSEPHRVAAPVAASAPPTPRAPDPRVASPAPAVPPSATSVPAPAARAAQAPAATPSEPVAAEPLAAGNEREAPEAAPTAATTGGASPARAAALYIGGSYREALTEYRLLAEAYPDERTYAEIVRILRHKLIDTCVRTQPERSEECRRI